MTRDEAAKIIDEESCLKCTLFRFGECRQKSGTCISAKVMAVNVLKEDSREEMKKLNVALAKECDRLARENRTLKFELEKFKQSPS